MEKVDRYQIIHPDGTKLSPVDMATLTEMVYAGIIKTDTPLFVVASRRTIVAGDIPYIAFLLSKLQSSPLAPLPRSSSPASASPPPAPLPQTPPLAEAVEPVETVPPLPERTPLRLPSLGAQPRAYILSAVIALTLLLGGALCQNLARARVGRERQELIGSWNNLDGTRLVFKPDGTGAITRPDSLYGNRTHLFRWERRGERLYLTEKRILLPGGTRQTAADSVETLGLSPDGRRLSLGRLPLQKER